MHSTSDTASFATVQAEAALWNPAAAACWSLVFTPAFGAYLLMRNWETLGDRQQAMTARRCYVFSLGLLAVQLLSGAFNTRLNSHSNLVHWVAIAWLCAWWLGAALPQARLLKARFGTGYPRKGWDWPLLVAVAAGSAYLALCSLFTYTFVALT